MCFPKAQRFVVNQRLQGAALDFQEAIFAADAHNGAERLRRLHDADAYLSNLRLSRQWGWLGSGQYEHASRMVAGVGKLLGGWIRQTKTAASGAAEGHQGD